MKVAVFANVRTTVSAQQEGFKDAFNCAFRSGAVLGYALTSLAILVLYLALLSYSAFFTVDSWPVMVNCISGYGLGG